MGRMAGRVGGEGEGNAQWARCVCVREGGGGR